MSLTLSNMLDRVKRNVPTTTMDAELQDALLERMNYLVSLDSFPFQEGYQQNTLSAGEYKLGTPDNFAYAKDVAIWTDNTYRQLQFLEPSAFGNLYPRPDKNTGDIIHYTIKIRELEIWFNAVSTSNLTIRMRFHKIPDSVNDPTVSQLTELAKITLIKWASADGFRMMGEHDRGREFEDEGNKIFTALKRRYQLALEEDARFISPHEVMRRRVHG